MGWDDRIMTFSSSKEFMWRWHGYSVRWYLETWVPKMMWPCDVLIWSSMLIEFVEEMHGSTSSAPPQHDKICSILGLFLGPKPGGYGLMMTGASQTDWISTYSDPCFCCQWFIHVPAGGHFLIFEVPIGWTGIWGPSPQHLNIPSS